ncbi:hypothetical protein [Micromonospora aurantiaca (nom. illeg.)]|uniref:hypothetical protein n=1 Tax=Micromonospora aurantiaca (nom. illeg.) TaxID=47850 RepID=UPI003F4A6C08
MTNWADVAKSLSPVFAAAIAVFGVALGARLSRRTTSDAFMRERIFSEMEKRREVAIAFRKALWVYSSRVQKMRDLAQEAADRQKAGKKVSIKFDLNEARAAQRATLDAFADLEMRATMQVQIPARNCLEALTNAFNYLTALRVQEGMAQLAYHEQQYAELSKELNKEAEHFNAIIYASFTPIWRALVNRVARKPLPYEVLNTPIELRNPEERIIPLQQEGDARTSR